MTLHPPLWRDQRRTVGRHFLRLWPVALLPAFVMIFAVWGCEKHKADKSATQQEQVEVTVVTVKPTDIPVSFEYVAQVQSSRQVSIQARVSGFLEKRVYTEGSLVKAGQTLFLMDQKPFKAQLDQAEAALEKSTAAFDVARKNLARVKPLAAADALSQRELDDATGQFHTSGAAVAQAKAVVEQAKLNLSYTVIKSPVDGITSYALQQDGSYLSPQNSQLTTVAVTSPIYVNFSLSENDRLKIRDETERGLLRGPKGNKYTAEIVLADGSIFSHTGQVTFANPMFNPQTGTFLVRITVDNPENWLRPNEFVRVRIKGATRPDAVLIPQRAVQQASRGHFVWVAGKSGKVEPRPVTLGDAHASDWFINDGLKAGDRVVVDGALALSPGAQVRVVSVTKKTDSPEAGAP
jgi:membrane fusion protein (multidrug efflux system)